MQNLSYIIPLFCTNMAVLSRECNHSKNKRFHSCETALVRVRNDLLRADDNRCCVVLLLLDLSAPFDSADHNLFLNRLEYKFAIGLLQLTITWYKIRHAGGQAHYSPTGTLKQRKVKLDWFRSLCFNVPVGE